MLCIVGLSLSVNMDICTEPSRKIVVKDTIDNVMQTGTYLRHLGTLSTTRSHYKIIIPFSTEKYLQGLGDVKGIIDGMLTTYNDTFQKNTWPNPMNISVTKARLWYEVENSYVRLKSAYKMVENEFISIADLFNDINPKKRLDRGLLNFVGEGLSFLFGVVSENQLNAANSRVMNAEKAEVNIIQSQKHLASVVNDQQLELANLQISQKKLQNHTAKFIQELKQLVFGQAAQTQQIFKLTIFERLKSFEQDVTQELTKIFRQIHKLETAVSLGIKGSLCPNFITPTVLSNLLLDINNHLPSHYLLPGITEPESFFKLYKILSVDVEVLTSGVKVFVIDIPIINENDIFQITLTTIFEMPFTSRINTTAKINLEHNKIYAINVNDAYGFILNPSELTHVKRFQTHYYGELNNWETANVSEIECILTFQQNQAFINQNCSKTIISHSTNNQFYHLSGDTWGFSIRGEISILVKCLQDAQILNSTQTLTLSGFGKVNIPKDCTVIFDRYVIPGIFSGEKRINVSGISSIEISQSAPANLAFSNIWSDFPNKTEWIIANLSKMQNELRNEIGFQIENTILHNKTTKLLKKVDDLLNLEMDSEQDFPWYNFNDVTKIDGILFAFLLLSILGNIFTFFILKSTMHKIIFKLFKTSFPLIE